MQIWQRNLSGAIRISAKEVTHQTALSEVRLVHLKRTVPQSELVGIVVLQITELLDFLGMSTKMNANSIFDTAEILLDKFDFHSIRGFQHCFNLIKTGEYPFDDVLYNTINGRKVIEFMQKYDKYIDDYLFAKATAKTEHDHMRYYDRPETERGLIALGNAFEHLKTARKK